MKFTPAKLFLLLALMTMLLGVGGCETNEPQNASVRPWNAPQGWENGLPDMGQHD